MVFNQGALFIGSLVVVVGWLSVLTVLLIRALRHYNALTKNVKKRALTDVLNALLKGTKSTEDRVDTLEKALVAMQVDGAGHIQRIGIVRFNPFADTGGAQSFVLALLDRQDNGLVMTSLYTRNGNRWYVKEVRSGKGKDVDLSKEEQAAIKQAKKIERKHT